MEPMESRHHENDPPPRQPPLLRRVTDQPIRELLSGPGAPTNSSPTTLRTAMPLADKVKPRAASMENTVDNANQKPIQDSFISTHGLVLPYGFGYRGMAPLRVVTRTNTLSTEASRETSPSTGRFRDLLKRNVGSSNSLKTSPSWPSFGEELSPTRHFAPTRLPVVEGKRQRLMRKLPLPGNRNNGIPAFEGNESLASVEPVPHPLHQHHHHFHRPHRRTFLQHLHLHHHLPITEHRQPLPELSRITPAPISTALMAAREASSDPNVLLAEMKPLPASFTKAFAALGQKPKALHPILPFLSRSVTAGSNDGGPVGSTFSLNNYSKQSRAIKHDNLIDTRHFLFKSYTNTRFQGHYLFRVQNDQVLYAPLPAAYESACSQYFRVADVTYRSLENRAKVSREERKAAQAAQVNQQEMNDIQTSIFSAATEPKETTTHLTVPRHSRSLDDDGLMSPMGSTREDRLDQFFFSTAPTSPVLGFDSSPFGLQGFSKLEDTADTQEQLAEPGMDSVSVHYTQSNRAGSISSYSDVSGRPLSFFLERSNSDPTGTISDGALDFAAVVAAVHDKLGESKPQPAWTLIQEQRRRDQLQKSFDDVFWLEAERQRCEEARVALYGLELFLGELIKGVEYDLFDDVHQIEILNENRETNLFSILNGDRTNILWLESPSLKLKHEFLNWIAISLGDHGEHEACPQVDHSIPQPSSLDLLIEQGGDGGQNKKTLDAKATMDYLIELSEIKLELIHSKITAMQQKTQGTIDQIEDTLDQLDNLDESAKNLMITMQRSIESQEVQLALKPSPTTGLTLAQLVETKIKDVNDRIVVCSRIMAAARFNLNRLQYEIELEQRSIKLFRKYKIIIGVVTVSTLVFAWILYQSRNAPFAPQPSTPLFSSRRIRNPFEVDEHALYGEGSLTLADLMGLSSSSSSKSGRGLAKYKLGSEEQCPAKDWSAEEDKAHSWSLHGLSGALVGPVASPDSPPPPQCRDDREESFPWGNVA